MILPRGQSQKAAQETEGRAGRQAVASHRCLPNALTPLPASHAPCQAVDRWEKSKAAAWVQHDADVKAAKAAFTENVARMLAEWREHKDEVDAMNAVSAR